MLVFLLLHKENFKRLPSLYNFTGSSHEFQKSIMDLNFYYTIQWKNHACLIFLKTCTVDHRSFDVLINFSKYKKHQVQKYNKKFRNYNIIGIIIVIYTFVIIIFKKNQEWIKKISMCDVVNIIYINIKKCNGIFMGKKKYFLCLIKCSYIRT